MNSSFKLSSVKETLNQNTFKILYYKNKVYLLPLSIIFLAILLVFFAIVPQVNDYFSLRDEEENIKEKIAITKSNSTFLSGLNEIELDTNLKITASALPVEKDFGGIFRVRGQAAAVSNVVLGDFSFQSATLSSLESKAANALPIEITLIINSGIDGAKRFLQELTRRLPLSEAVNIQTGESSSTISVVFYYKPYTAVTINQDSNLKPLSKDEVSVVRELSLFK